MNSVILEIRAGTGGDEAGLFATELLRMYQKFAHSQGWKFEPRDNFCAEIKGEGVLKALRHESGVHRVQRVPKTERSGRIHTSTVTVAILPKVLPTELQLDPKNLKIETFRSSGPGGQHMQKSESAVRITHLPTGITASCQDERSQHRNRTKAEEVLRSRLFQMMQEQNKSKVDDLRRGQIGTASREEKIRTYNFPQNRITDHRLGKSWHNLKEILDGYLGVVTNSFVT